MNKRPRWAVQKKKGAAQKEKSLVMKHRAGCAAPWGAASGLAFATAYVSGLVEAAEDVGEGVHLPKRAGVIVHKECTTSPKAAG